MVRKTLDCILEETIPLPILEVSEKALSEAVVVVPNPPLKISKASVRTSLQASTLDGVFATIFSSATTGVLLTNFLLELGATSVEIGFLSSIPMFVNLLQPLGAYLADRTTSRHWYSVGIFGCSRLLWLILLLGIVRIGESQPGHHQLVIWTLIIVLVTHILGALGGASWFSWMAALVPRRLRGRYFGVRNSAANLINLVGVPLMGLGISSWKGGTIQGYSIILLLGVLAGLMSLVCQFFIVDVNPQEPTLERQCAARSNSTQSTSNWFKDANFLTFLLYFGSWMFAVNLSAPFFNLYMLDNLHLDISLVTLYGSLTAGANLLMLVMWGKLADRIGNRPILVFMGILAAMIPLFWLGTGANSASVWVWLPLVHLLSGGTWAAIDLCNHNIQMSVAPSSRSQTVYFAIACAIAGVAGAIGTATGGFLAQLSNTGGLPGLFALSAVLRLLALLPLVFVQEPRSVPLIDVWKTLRIFLKPVPFVSAKPQLAIAQSWVKLKDEG
ncbi:MAG TPA: MFS transporter [Cyanobacteria bacterium UBA8543]|nr:MFS transporter [Cyanobacteria bacterium UBA8543]